MLGTHLCAGIPIESKKRPWHMYAFCVILLISRYAYAAYPTVFVRQIELLRVCLFVIQIENLQIDKHVELLLLKFICKSVYFTTESHRTNWSFYSAKVFKASQRGKKVICYLFICLSVKIQLNHSLRL